MVIPVLMSSTNSYASYYQRPGTWQLIWASAHEVDDRRWLRCTEVARETDVQGKKKSFRPGRRACRNRYTLRACFFRTSPCLALTQKVEREANLVPVEPQAGLEVAPGTVKVRNVDFKRTVLIAGPLLSFHDRLG